MRGGLCPIQGACQGLSKSKDPGFLSTPLYIFLSKGPVAHQALGPWDPHPPPPSSLFCYWGGVGSNLILSGRTGDRILSWMREGKVFQPRCLSAGFSAMDSLRHLGPCLPHL